MTTEILAEHGKPTVDTSPTKVEPAMPSPLDLFFANKFNTSYARNNKSKVKKNVRCFPQCCDVGHSSSQFCGQSVQIHVSSKDGFISSEEMKSLLVVGCFVCNKDEQPCTAGQSLSESELRSVMRASNMVQGSLVSASGAQSNTFLISSNSGWNYLNSVNQTRGQACHSFRVFCFSPSPSGTGFLCRASSSSTLFQVSSTKRNKKHALKIKTDRSLKPKRPRTVKTEPATFLSLLETKTPPPGELQYMNSEFLGVHSGANDSTATQAIDTNATMPAILPINVSQKCPGMGTTLCAQPSAEPITFERELLEQYLDTFVLDDKVATSDTESDGSLSHSSPRHSGDCLSENEFAPSDYYAQVKGVTTSAGPGAMTGVAAWAAAGGEGWGAGGGWEAGGGVGQASLEKLLLVCG
jgi:hypothetical protein